MKIFVAGATGAMGGRLVPMLVERGHEVTGTTTDPAREGAVRALGATPATLDILDAEAVRAAVGEAGPEVVVHQATALGSVDLRRFDKAFALTNRLRTEGTDNLLRAAREAGARRLVAQSFAGWPYARTGGPVKSEDDPLDPSPAPKMRETLDAIRRLERAVTEAEGIEGVVLRYGGFYGPGTGMGPEGDQLEMVRKRRFPIIGRGAGVWSLVHIDDAASATVAAIEGGEPGIYNVADDEPAPVAEWLPVLASSVGAKPPRRIPAWLGRIAGGEHSVVLMNDIRGASNAKAKRELGWQPAYPSWREGFAAIT